MVRAISGRESLVERAEITMSTGIYSVLSPGYAGPAGSSVRVHVGTSENSERPQNTEHAAWLDQMNESSPVPPTLPAGSLLTLEA